MDWQFHHDEPSTTSPPSADRLGRRRLLTAAGTAAVVGLAGCADVANSVAELALGEVNLFNETGQQVAGSITVTGPEGSTVLDERFEIEPSSDDEESDDEESGGELRRRLRRSRLLHRRSRTRRRQPGQRRRHDRGRPRRRRSRGRTHRRRLRGRRLRG
ncbi:hypothetical protein [Halohasta salina]|uniref:hypothetical protein n=1 Tax=Halohasta salina TaxID=2961621 RepID=UPI0020A35964|nr:hypothetical protein [Halohasta salina]